MVIAELAVQRGAGADAVTAQHLHDPPDADPVAVSRHRPVAHVQDPRVLARHPLVLIARHHVIEPEELDVRIDPKRDPAPPGQVSFGRRVIGTY
jgi:hypothetical protein